MSAGPGRRPVQTEAKDGPLRFFSQSQCCRWTGRFAPIDAEHLVAIRFPENHFPPHATCFRDHVQSDSIMLRQSLLYLYLQACLSVKPEVVMISTGFSDDTVGQLLDDQDAELPESPLEQVILVPLCKEKLQLVMAFLNDKVRPQSASAEEAGGAAPPKRQPSSRSPLPNIVAGQADWRRIRNETILARATELLVGQPIESVERLLALPTLDLDAGEIASNPLYAGHILNVCNPLRVLPDHGGRALTEEGLLARLQNDPNSYFAPNDTGGITFNPIPEIDELRCRFLNPLEQNKVFEDPAHGIDANILGRMLWPHRSPPLPMVRSQLRIMYESLHNPTPWAQIADVHPRSLLVGGLTPREIERGDTLTKCGMLLVEPPIPPLVDPQANSMLVETTLTKMAPGMNTNDRIIQAAYPAQHRFIHSNSDQLERVLSDPEPGERLIAHYKEVWRSGIMMLEEDGRSMPLALRELLDEKRAITDELRRLQTQRPQQYKYVMQLYGLRGQKGPVGGFDSVGTVLTQLVHIFHRDLNMMSNQIPSMLLILLQAWCGPTQNTNEKECIAMLGTAAAGKSKILGFVELMSPQSIIRVHGDESAGASTYETSDESDCRFIVSDEKFGMGNNQASKDLENSRGGMVLKTMLAEGFVSKGIPVSTTDETGGTRFKTEREMSAARSTRAFCRNEKGVEGPIESRIHNADVSDAPLTEQRFTLLRPKPKHAKLELVSLFGRMCGSLQVYLNFPGHFGLHNAAECDTDLIPVGMATMDSVGLTPPIGRSLNQFTWTVRSVTYARVLAEVSRFETKRKFEDWERAFIIQAHMVTSPADIIAGVGLYYGCSAQDSLLELILATFVEFIEPTFTKEDEDSTPVFTGFAQHQGKYYVLTSGSSRSRNRGADPLSDLATRIYNNHKAKYCESHSVPVIEDMLRDLERKQTKGVTALLIVEHEVEGRAGSHNEQRWAVSQELLHKTRFARVDRILALAANLQNLRASSSPPCDFYTMDEEDWLIPTDISDSLTGDILMNPTDYVLNPNDSIRRIALGLISPIARTKEGRKAQPRLTKEEYDKWFRFAERARMIEVGQSNTFNAYSRVDPLVARDGDPMSIDGVHRLMVSQRSGSAIRINADRCNEIVKGNVKPNMFRKAAKIIQAIMLPPEALDVGTMHKLWFGVERNDAGEKRISAIEPEDLADISITMADLSSNSEIPDHDLFLADDIEEEEDEFERIWPGEGPECTFEYGDGLYDRALRNRWRKFGIFDEQFDEYKMHWHLPNWRPSATTAEFSQPSQASRDSEDEDGGRSPKRARFP